MLGLDFHVVSIFCLHRSLNKIHAWNFFFSEKSLLMESPLYKKGKKNSPVKATDTGGAPRWCPDFEQRSRRRTKTCNK